MKKLYLLLPILFLIYWGCEEGQDTTPPTVTITFSTESSVSEIVTITCISTDNKGVEKVELWVNGVSTGVSDNTEPYSLDWNTTTLRMVLMSSQSGLMIRVETLLIVTLLL